MIAWLTGKMAPATLDTIWHADTATMELGASPRAREDMDESPREPPKIARRPMTSLAPHKVGTAMSWMMLDASVNHFFHVYEGSGGVRKDFDRSRQRGRGEGREEDNGRVSPGLSERGRGGGGDRST